MNLDSFRTNLLKTTLFTEKFANYLSIIVVMSEIILIVIMLFRKKTGLLLIAILIFIFTIYISYLKFNGLYEVCGCGGVLNGLSYYRHLFINIFLVCSSTISYFILKHFENEK